MNRELAVRVSADAFEKRYAKQADPWNFSTSRYENDRYQKTLLALSKDRYGRVYEPGCSIGVLTAQLAARATQVIAIDVSSSAVREARVRCKGLSNVEILCESVASYRPAIPLDLVVFSEIGYYFESDEIIRIASDLAQRLDDAGEFIAVHWLGHSDDHVLHGDVVHEVLLTHLPLKWLRGERHEKFRIDVWGKR